MIGISAKKITLLALIVSLASCARGPTPLKPAAEQWPVASVAVGELPAYNTPEDDKICVTHQLAIKSDGTYEKGKNGLPMVIGLISQPKKTGIFSRSTYSVPFIEAAEIDKADRAELDWEKATTLQGVNEIDGVLALARYQKSIQEQIKQDVANNRDALLNLPPNTSQISFSDGKLVIEELTRLSVAGHNYETRTKAKRAP